MNLVETSAFFFGASPLASAVILSLVVTLLLMMVTRVVVWLGPSVKTAMLQFPAVLRWRRKLATDHQVLTLTILCLSAVSVLAFVITTALQGFSETTPLGAWDRTFVVTAHRHIQPFELAFFRFATELAGRAASLILGVGLGLLFLVRKKRRLLYLWAGGLLGNSVIIQVIKQHFERPRPNFLDPLLVEQNFSFPSGHAAASVLMFGLLAYLFLLHKPHLSGATKFGVVIAVVWCGVFIGTSRLALGVHYPSDVVTGWFVAFIWLAIIILIDQLVFRQSDAATPVGNIANS